MLMRPTIEMIQLKLHYVIPRSSDCQIFNNYFFSVLEAPPAREAGEERLINNVIKGEVQAGVVTLPRH